MALVRCRNEQYPACGHTDLQHEGVSADRTTGGRCHYPRCGCQQFVGDV